MQLKIRKIDVEINYAPITVNLVKRNFNVPFSNEKINSCICMHLNRKVFIIR